MLKTSGFFHILWHIKRNWPHWEERHSKCSNNLTWAPYQFTWRALTVYCLFTGIYWAPLQGRSCLPISPHFSFHLHANLVCSATAAASRHPWVASLWFKICMENYSWPKSKSKTSSWWQDWKGSTSEHPLNKRVATQWREDAAIFSILGNKDVWAACP